MNKCEICKANKICDHNLFGFEICNNYIPEDAVEVKHGQWELTESKLHFNVVCSNCNEDFYVYKKGQYRIQNSNYCPNCGAKMDGERRTE